MKSLDSLAVAIALMVAIIALGRPGPGDAAVRSHGRAETKVNDPAGRLSAGGAHTCQLLEDGTVRCWGANESGQLGNGAFTTDRTVVPVLVTGLGAVVAVSTGGNHTCALIADGTARCWGSNTLGQLGDGGASGTRSLTPVVVSGLTSAVAIAAGGAHTCALLANGAARCWGNNIAGQLGDGGASGAKRLTPNLVGFGVSPAVAITAGGDVSCVVLADGSGRCWGNNSLGQVGDGTRTARTTPTPVSGLAKAIAISANFNHACALLASGSVRCWGRNLEGQLGDGTFTNRLTAVTVSGLNNVVAITAGGLHTCALIANGTGKCWGSNGSGQIGDGTTTTRPTAVAVAAPFNALNNAVAVDAGGSHTCAALADGTAKCWGSDLSGQLGYGNSPASTGPGLVVGGGAGTFTAHDVSAGRNHTCAVRANGAVACWGSNASGQLGDGTTTTRSSPVAVNALVGTTTIGFTNAIAVAAGDAHTCALRADGTAWCWGDNTFGQLGDGTTTRRLTPVPVTGLGNAVIAIAAGGTLGTAHTCALLANGTVWCWGSNGSGQLGNGLTTPSSRPVFVGGIDDAISIDVGEFYSCAMRAGGFASCWGSNNNGQLGNSFVTNPFHGVTIAAGNTHACAVQAVGDAICWGGNLLGQVGNGTMATKSSPSAVLNESGFVQDQVTAIAGGFGHSCALVATNGGARCFGDNGVGQLGSVSTASSLVSVPVVVARNALFTTLFLAVTRTTQVTAGRRHSCLLYATGGLQCWGENTSGQLGIGSTTNQSHPVTVPSFTVNIDTHVGLEHDARVSEVVILALCEVGQRVQVEVTLAQGTASGHGMGTGHCTGALEAYPVTVPAQGREGFVAGPAEVSAHASILEPGVVVETQDWTRNVTIANAP